MASEIKIGSIIHLKNGNNGYLDVRGLVRLMPDFWNIAGTERTFVFTHPQKDRDRGSGSWRILSASGKNDGDPLEYGDFIHLKSMAGEIYLNVCGGVEHLIPFQSVDRQMATGGVFTSSYRNRDNGTGVWKVVDPNDSNSKKRVCAGEVICLQNCFPVVPKEGILPAGYLVTHEEVNKRLPTGEFTGSNKLVFVNRNWNESNPTENGQWTFEINHRANITPVNRYYIWGQENDRWIDYGMFKLEGEAEPIVGLTLKPKAETKGSDGAHLEGSVTYRGASLTSIELKQEQDAGRVVYQLTGSAKPFTWVLGGRHDKPIFAIDVSSYDDGKTLIGEIKYGNERKIPLKGLLAHETWIDEQPRTVLYDFFQVDVWKGRIKRIEEALQTAVYEFDAVLTTLEDASIEKLMTLISQAGGESYAHFESDYFYALAKDENEADVYDQRVKTLFSKLGTDKHAIRTAIQQEEDSAKKLPYSVDLTHLNEKIEQLLQATELALPLELNSVPSDTTTPIDSEFQLKQLLNIYTLWLSMDQFWKALSQRSQTAVEALIQANMLPPVDLIRRCFRQFTLDFEILQNCIRQRRWSKRAHETGSENIQASSLIVTDKLAARAMAPFKHLITDSEDFVPITFFSNKVYVRQLAYTNKFIFIGLSYDLSQPTADDQSRVFTPFELMAIPHEIGHYIYRYMKLVKLATSNQAEPLTFAKLSHTTFAAHPYRAWCEEIFADLYGCFISGPFTVLGMQALIATEDKRMVIDDDDEHPTGIFRPYFLSEMLRKLHEVNSSLYQFNDIATLLDANWTAILERWGYVAENIKNGRPARISLPDEAQNYQESFINVDKAIQLLEPIIDKFARELVSHSQSIDDLARGETSKEIPWCVGNDVEHSSLEDYIKEIQALADYKLATHQIADHRLSSKSRMSKELGDKMEDVLEGRIEFLGENLYQYILDGWGDKGPTGFGGH